MFPLITFSCSIRDNPQHGTAILGGMWGARMDTGMRNIIDLSFRRLIHNVEFQVAYMLHMSQGMMKHKRVSSPPLSLRVGWDTPNQKCNVCDFFMDISLRP